MLSDALLSQFSEFLAARLGLHFPSSRRGDVERAIRAAAKDFGFDEPASCLRWLLSAPLSHSQLEVLASHVTVGETYFFREPAVFAALERQILPDLIRSRAGTERYIRIWSAGCSSGEEAYSIAIALTRLLPDRRAWNISILGSDINPRFLAKASRGLYSEWSFRDVPAEVKNVYFTRRSKGRFEVAAPVKAMVTWRHLNLADDVYPSVETNTNAMDIIFCRNVLMYFEPERARAVIEKLGRALAEGGWLIVSSVEAAQVAVAPFVPVRFPGVVLYRKDSNAPRASRPAPAMPARASAQFDRQAAAVSAHKAEPRNAPVEDRRTRTPEPERDVMPQKEEHLPAGEQIWQRASTYYADGRYAEAAEAAHVLLLQDPGDVRPMVLLARAYANQGRLADAEHWCQRAMAADKLNPSWTYLYASIQQERGNAEAAMAALKRTLYLDPDHVLTHFSLGTILGSRGAVRESARHFKTALSLLERSAPDSVLPESDGLTAGRLIEIVKSMLAIEEGV